MMTLKLADTVIIDDLEQTTSADWLALEKTMTNKLDLNLSGKGMFIHKIIRCDNGDPERIARAAANAGFSHVLIKILDGPWPYNQRRTYVNGQLVWVDDILEPVVKAIQSRGIAVWGWQWVYLNNPIREAEAAIARMSDLGLDGFVINAETDAKGKRYAAGKYSQRLQEGLAPVPIALSSYRYPALHQELPWGPFLDVCSLVMPQVYWMGATNAGEQLRRCVNEYQDITDLPIVPTGAAFYQGGWSASPDQVQEFIQTAGELGLPAVNFWEWYYARKITGMWGVVSDGVLPDPPPDPEPEPDPELPETIRITAYPRLNIRNTPMVATGNRIGTVIRGQEVPVLERSGIWYRISIEGWVHGDYVEEMK